MTPAARVAAAIEVLDVIRGGAPAEKALTGWARRSRFAGSKDRAAVRDHVYQALRCRRTYAALGGADTGRGLMIGALRAAGEDTTALFTGEGHAPDPLSEAEEGAGHLPGGNAEALDLPEWLWPHFRAALGETAAEAAELLRQRAPVMLRVNLRKATREGAITALAAEGITAVAEAIAATALRVTEGTRRVATSQAYQDGLIELQDGSSQAAMCALEVPAGGRVLDYCAGGGGKVLALAARHEARWFAHDGLPQRMKDLPARARRAGVQVQQVGKEALNAGSFDLVLCDVPCSGSGTWRRAPDAKWRMQPDDLRQLAGVQRDILAQAAPLVAPWGCLAYATCSVLREENEDQITAFVAQQPSWRPLLSRRWPVSVSGDGFFLSVLCRGGQEQ